MLMLFSHWRDIKSCEMPQLCWHRGFCGMRVCRAKNEHQIRIFHTHQCGTAVRLGVERRFIGAVAGCDIWTNTTMLLVTKLRGHKVPSVAGL
jgi:hypothetical protein